MTVKVLLATVMALSLGGCSLAPTVEKPEPSVPENWSSARLSANEKLPLDWWRGFGDPALVTLVEEALGANSDLQLAAARVAEARARLTGQQAEQYPLLEVEGSAVRQGPSEEVVNSAGGGQPFNDIQVGGVLSYELDLWGRLANASEAARARLLASAANREAVRLAVIGEMNVPGSVPAGRPADLMVRRPDIAAAEQELIAANAEIGVARAAFLPRISFEGLLGLRSASGGDLFQGSASTWQLGGSLVGPLLDFGRSEALVNQAEARQRQALIAYRQAIQVAFREVLDAMAGVRGTEDRLEAQARQVAALRSTTKLARLRFEGGASSYLEVLDAERSLFTTELDLVETRRDQLQSTVNLYRALGGGWQSSLQSSDYANTD